MLKSDFAVTSMIAGDCFKSWPMHWKRLDRQAFFSMVMNGLPTGYWIRSLHCRRILGGRNLVRVRNVVVAAIFDFMIVEDWGE